MRLIQEKAKVAALPIYLESTLEAVDLYQRLGFVEVDGLQMPIPARGSTTPCDIYKEVCMVWMPQSAEEKTSVATPSTRDAGSYLSCRIDDRKRGRASEV